jgi:hypothetical protein
MRIFMKALGKAIYVQPMGHGSVKWAMPHFLLRQMAANQ